MTSRYPAKAAYAARENPHWKGERGHDRKLCYVQKYLKKCGWKADLSLQTKPRTNVQNQILLQEKGWTSLAIVNKINYPLSWINYEFITFHHY